MNWFFFFWNSSFLSRDMTFNFRNLFFYREILSFSSAFFLLQENQLCSGFLTIVLHIFHFDGLRKLFIHLWLHWVSFAARGLSLVVASRGYAGCGARASHCGGFSCRGAQALGCEGVSSCGTWAPKLWLTGSRAQALQSWYTGLVATWHMGFSRIRDQTRVPCIGRRIHNDWATRGVPDGYSNSSRMLELSH